MHSLQKPHFGFAEWKLGRNNVLVTALFNRLIKWVRVKRLETQVKRRVWRLCVYQLQMRYWNKEKWELNIENMKSSCRHKTCLHIYLYTQSRNIQRKIAAMLLTCLFKYGTNWMCQSTNFMIIFTFSPDMLCSFRDENRLRRFLLQIIQPEQGSIRGTKSFQMGLHDSVWFERHACPRSRCPTGPPSCCSSIVIVFSDQLWFGLA